VAHDLAEVACRRLKQQVVVVAHQAVGMYRRSIPFRGGLQIAKELLPVSPCF
jgi:hypothetical protein